MNIQTAQGVLENFNSYIPEQQVQRTRERSAQEDRCKPEEVALIQRVIGGDTSAYYDLVKPYQRAVFAAAIGVVGNSGEAEDIAQEALLKALKHLHTFRMDSRFSTWLVQIAINEGRMRLRQNRRPMESLDERRNEEEGEGPVREIADTRLDPHGSYAQQELRAALEEAILALPTIYREVFVLRDVDHLSIAETAEALKITEESVKTRLRRARLRMQSSLKRFY